MNDLDLANDSSCIGCHEKPSQMVYQELVPAYGTMRRVYRINPLKDAPFGPKLVRTRSDNSETAAMLRRTASSIPELCCFFLKKSQVRFVDQRLFVVP